MYRGKLGTSSVKREDRYANENINSRDMQMFMPLFLPEEGNLFPRQSRFIQVTVNLTCNNY